MTHETVLAFSNQCADAIASAASSVVQVRARRRPASGVVFAPGLVVTTARALGREDGVHVRGAEGAAIEAELAGWDPATNLVVLRAPALAAPAATPAQDEVRAGQLALAVARSWSNAVTASAGIVSVVGGPLPTGHGRSIDRIIRTTAPMHEGFAGGALLDATGKVTGIATAAAIRGLAVVIPVDIAWKTAQTIAEHGSPRSGFLGIAGQPVRLAPAQRSGDQPEEALLVAGVSAGGPAEAGGILVGDVIMAIEGHPIASPVDLLEWLRGDRVGQKVIIRVLRGGTPIEVTATIAERPRS